MNPPPQQAACTPANTITAQVVALDQPFWWNRLGAYQPQGMMYALKGDVVDISGNPLPAEPSVALAGNVRLRDGKRPRPLTLRMNAGQCLAITFTNLLRPADAVPPPHDKQPATRNASIHVNGLQLVGSIASDGTNVGRNEVSGLVPPGGTTTYTLYADTEGTHLFYSGAAMTGGEGNNSSISAGLFGAVNVEPAGAEWYRSQVTRVDMELAAAGWTDTDHPILNYDAVYEAPHPLAGRPILSILQGNEIVHGDLNAIITGPGREHLDPDHPVEVNRDRTEPFREFTVIFHDEVGAVQAFPEFTQAEFQHTLHSVRDAFAINYGTGGIGAEILANRFGVGPMWNCTECKYEEFFLSSWAVGDPAMVVDVPANTTDAAGLITGPKASAAFYPDDPSNVFHSYLNDHVKIRNLHAGPKEHHVFHLHAHQWLNTADSDNSSYMDSQAIGPGSEYTYEITYDGGGNRNKTPGDAIFHCHFYPHFAQGMWALWRNHDAFELGTVLMTDGSGMVDAGAPGNRALPDGEIAGGTPIPGLVPIPGKAMAPMPAPLNSGNPEAFVGYPFYLPGVAGHRPPTAPLDLVVMNGEVVDGGLPRHVVVDNQTSVVNGHPVSGIPTPAMAGSSGTVHSTVTRLDMGKENVTMNALELPEDGTPIEQAAMAFHAVGDHPSYVQPTDGSLPLAPDGVFRTSGLPEVRGAPFADPCVADDLRTPVLTTRIYQSTDIQIDATINKAGWHVPQHRMRALAADVPDLISGDKAPEPLFFRANTGDCVEYEETNLIPKDYEMDDFQVRTPTDVIGAHIHLVKFDVTASDGSANGYNYEDGALAPGEVRERIAAINCDGPGCGANGEPGFGGLIVNDGETEVDMLAPVRKTLTAKVHPIHGAGPNGDWIGARTNVQRWYVDDVLNTDLDDRTLRTVFTHDHYGPSTHQQVGLYASLVVEPYGSEWRDPVTGDPFGERWDGGPTSWNADIIAGSGGADSYREFLFQTADFALSYEAGAGVGPDGPIPDPLLAINPPAKRELGLPLLVGRPVNCPLLTVAPPCPEAISADDPGTMLVNYRNEPLALRVRDPGTNTQAAGRAGDLSYAFSSDLGTETLADGTIVPVTRADDLFNTQPDVYPPLTPDVRPGDPFTPMMRAYAGDRIQVRLQNGGQEEGHNFTMHGMKWLAEPSWDNSGYVNGQMYGISEHFELAIPYAPKVDGDTDQQNDYLYQGGAATDDLWNGMWGLLRTYEGRRDDLQPLPNNPDANLPPIKSAATEWRGVCPALPDPLRRQGRRWIGAEAWEPQNRRFDIVAALARDILPGGTLVYNEADGGSGVTLHDPTAIMFVHSSDLDSNGRLKAGVPVEPLVMRANAGDCILVTLRNRLPEDMPDLDGYNALPLLVDEFNNNQIKPSAHIGLHPQLVSYNVQESDGANVGLNMAQTVAPGDSAEYLWYAGHTDIDENGVRTATPIEFGATSLMASDRIKHASKGAIGALIIEPQYSTWETDYEQGIGQQLRAAATVIFHSENGDSIGHFRELAVQFQDDVNMRIGGGDGVAVENLAEAEDAEDTGQKALNYRTEPIWNRMAGMEAGTPLTVTNGFDFSNVLSNTQVQGRDPVTPILEVKAGTETRFRITQSGGHARNHALTIHGHSWQQMPWTDGSTKIGDNERSNEVGVQAGIGVASHLNLVLNNGAGGAGGRFLVEGDYLFRDMASFTFDGGMWGILRVTDPNATDTSTTDTNTTDTKNNNRGGRSR